MPVEDEKKFTRGGNQAASQRFQSSALEIEVLSATAPEDHEYTGDPKHCHPCALRAFVNAELRTRAVERELQTMQPERVAGYDAQFWHDSYMLLRDAITNNLDDCIRDDDVAEEAILVEAVEAAGRRLGLMATVPDEEGHR